MKKSVFVFTFVLILFITSISSGEKNKPYGYTGSSICAACHTDEYNTWKTSKHALEFKPGTQDSQNCLICHSTGLNLTSKEPVEKNIGCEACHGPGEYHVKSGGEAGSIISDNSADICGRCHNGNSSEDLTALLSFKPGMKLSEIINLNLIDVSPDKTVPFYKDIHPSLTYNMWRSSGHSKAPGRNTEINNKNHEGPVTCSVCHNPHNSSNPSQLVMDSEKLCRECHFQGSVLKGYGAKGIEETRSLHTAMPCTACHMTEKNHLMKMIRPDDPDLSEDRLDSCCDCHEVKDRKMRAKQLLDMEAWYNESFEPLIQSLKSLKKKLDTDPELVTPEFKNILHEIDSNLAIIIKDGSNGVHNLDYALEIMYRAKRQLKKIKKGLK